MFGKIIFSTLISFSFVSYAELDSLERLQKQTASILSGASGEGRDLEAAEYLLGKFKFSPDGKPTWYPEFYPDENEMVPGTVFKPRISLLKRNTGTDVLLSPVLEIFQKKNAAQVCERISPLLSFNSNLGDPYCLEDAKRYAVDSTRLASLEESPQSDQYQSALVSVFNMDALSDLKKSQLMTDPNVSIQTILNNAPTSSDKQALIDPRRVRFLKYNADPNNPLALKSISAQVGELLVDIPVELPPSPRCEIRLSGQTSDLGFEPGTTISVDFFADSVLTWASLSGDDFFSSEEVELPARQRSDLIGTMTRVGTRTFSVPQNPLPGNSLAPEGDLVSWKIDGLAYGVNSSVAATTCESLIVPVKKVLPPDCSLTASPANLTVGQSTTVSLISTNRVSSITIDGRSVVPNSNGEASVLYVKKTNAPSEKITALISGPGGESQCEVVVGATCPFNDSNHVGQLMSAQAFQAFLNENELREGITIFQDGRRGDDRRSFNRDVSGNFNISSKWLGQIDQRYSVLFSKSNKVFTVDNAPRGTTRRFLTGVHGLNKWDVCGRASAKNVICMRTIEVTGNRRDSTRYEASYLSDSTNTMHSFWAKAMGDAHYVKLGPADSPSCTVQKAYFRTNGCFSSSTKIAMVDGSQRKISDIMENDYVLNPHFGAGVRVKKVVKGPEKKSLYEIQIGKKKVEVTEDHPFFTQKGWLQASELKTGDKLMGEGVPQVITRTQKLLYKGPQDVWNFELDTEEPMAHVVIANGIPSGDLVTQLELKKPKAKLP